MLSLFNSRVNLSLVNTYQGSKPIHSLQELADAVKSDQIDMIVRNKSLMQKILMVIKKALFKI